LYFYVFNFLKNQLHACVVLIFYFIGDTVDIVTAQKTEKETKKNRMTEQLKIDD